MTAQRGQRWCTGIYSAASCSMPGSQGSLVATTCHVSQPSEQRFSGLRSYCVEGTAAPTDSLCHPFLVRPDHSSCCRGESAYRCTQGGHLPPCTERLSAGGRCGKSHPLHGGRSLTFPASTVSVV